jgi:hypothetical protein
MRLVEPYRLLACLAGRIEEGVGEYLPKDQAYEILKRWTGQDFGYDTELWSVWFEDNRGKVDTGRALTDAVRAVRGPPDPDVDDPEEIARVEAEIAEMKRRWDETHPKPAK